MIFSCEDVDPIYYRHGDVIGLIFFDVLLNSLFHVLEVKKKYALKNNFEKYFKGDFVVPQDYFRNGGGMYINVPQDYKSSGA